MSIESVFLTLIAQAEGNGDTAGALALRTAHEQIPMYSDWINRADAGYPSADSILDLTLQRYAPGQAGDIEQKIVRGARVSYPKNDWNHPVFFDNSNGDAIEVAGWYATHYAYPLSKPDPVPHNEP